MEEKIYYVDSLEELLEIKKQISEKKQILEKEYSKNQKLITKCKSLNTIIDNSILDNKEIDKQNQLNNNYDNDIKMLEIENTIIEKCNVECEQSLLLIEQKQEHLKIQEQIMEQLDTIEKELNVGFYVTGNTKNGFYVVEEEKQENSVKEKNVNNAFELGLEDKNVDKIIVKTYDFETKNLNGLMERSKEILSNQNKNLEKLLSEVQNPSQQIRVISLANEILEKSISDLPLELVMSMFLPRKISNFVLGIMMFNNVVSSINNPRRNYYIKDNLLHMLNDNETCLSIGIASSEEILSEIDGIRKYLQDLPIEVKSTMEYKKYKLSVETASSSMKKQMSALKRISKQYDVVKVKIKQNNKNIY